MVDVINWCCLHARRTGFLATVVVSAAMGGMPVQAQTAAPGPGSTGSSHGVYVEAGPAIGGDPTASAVLGFTWNFGRTHAFEGGLVTTYGEVFVSQWRARRVVGGDPVSYSQVGAIASARYRFDEGRSPWFADVGLGMTTMNRTYETPEHHFSTRFQFTPVVSAGRNFGQGGVHELSLRLQHFSNAGISEPNPGKNFLRLRYLYRF